MQNSKLCVHDSFFQNKWRTVSQIISFLNMLCDHLYVLYFNKDDICHKERITVTPSSSVEGMNKMLKLSSYHILSSDTKDLKVSLLKWLQPSVTIFTSKAMFINSISSYSRNWQFIICMIMEYILEVLTETPASITASLGVRKGSH
jgi:hypothetical protein